MVKVRIFGNEAKTHHSVEMKSAAAQATWAVPEEVPVAFIYNRRNYAVMMATPANLSEFAVGFSITERVIDHCDDISSIDIHQSDQGIEFHIAIAPKMLERLDVRQQRRNLVGRAGCGICGLENADVIFAKLPIVAEKRRVLEIQVLEAALQDLEKWQPLNDKTKTVHAAAFVSNAGHIHMVREDVGRHNALDKLLGAIALERIDPSDGFVLISSRCSYEIIEKSARMGIQAVASISGPTAFAIRKAAEANIALYCKSGDTFLEVTSLGQ